jgi:hypothetical protein
MYCFVSALRKEKFFGVPSRTIVKVGSAVGKKMLRNTEVDYLKRNILTRVTGLSEKLPREHGAIRQVKMLHEAQMTFFFCRGS